MAEADAAFQLHRGETEAWEMGHLAEQTGEDPPELIYASAHLLHRTATPLWFRMWRGRSWLGDKALGQGAGEGGCGQMLTPRLGVGPRDGSLGKWTGELLPAAVFRVEAFEECFRPGQASACLRVPRAFKTEVLKNAVGLTHKRGLQPALGWLRVASGL